MSKDRTFSPDHPHPTFLKRRREIAKLTQREVGDRMGVTAQTVHKWERDRYLNVADLIKLAALYDIAPTEFFVDPEQLQNNDSLKAFVAAATMAGIHPAALFVIKGDLTRMDEAHDLTQLIELFEKLPAEHRKHWLAIGQMFPALMEDRRENGDG